MDRRNTPQKELVLSAVSELNHPTADEVYEFISKKNPRISRGTVYRNLNVLAEEGKILKLVLPDGPDRFDSIVSDHYHVKCIKCGKVFDVEAKITHGLESKISDSSGVTVTGYDILFKGICPRCNQND